MPEQNINDLEAEVREAVEAGVKARDAALASAGDPSKSPEQIVGDRASALVDQITDAALGELRVLRDEIDNQMRALVARRDELKSQICSQVALAKQAIDVKTIANDAVVKLTRSIESGLPQPVARVITHKRNGASA